MHFRKRLLKTGKARAVRFSTLDAHLNEGVGALPRTR